MSNKVDTKVTNSLRSFNLKEHSPFPPKRSILLRDGMELMVTRFPRSSTLLSEDIEKFIDDDDQSYLAWKNQLENPHRTTKVRGLRIKSTSLISGHLISLKRDKDHRDFDKKNETTKDDIKHTPSSSNHVVDSHGDYHPNKRIDMSKDKFMPCLTRHFHRINIQPALTRFKMFMHHNIAVAPTNSYRRFNIIYPPNFVTHTPHNYEYVLPNIAPPYSYYT